MKITMLAALAGALTLVAVTSVSEAPADLTIISAPKPAAAPGMSKAASPKPGLQGKPKKKAKKQVASWAAGPREEAPVVVPPKPRRAPKPNINADLYDDF